MSLADRREIIRMTLASFLALSAQLPTLAQRLQQGGAGKDSQTLRGPLNWDGLISRIDSFARGQYVHQWDQAKYVRQIEQLAMSLDFKDPTIRQKLRGAQSRFGPRPAIEEMETRQTFQVSLITFEKGQVLPLHDHPQMTGVMTCAVGLVNVRRFQFLSMDQVGNGCTLQDDGIVEMEPGVVSSLTAHTGNVHGLRAREFSQDN